MSENLIYTNEYTLQSSTLRSPWAFKYCGYTHSFSFLVFHHETMNDSWRFTHSSSSNKNKTDTWWGGKIITTWSQSMALFGAKKLQESLLKLLYKQIIKFCLHLNRLTSLFSSFLLFFFFCCTRRCYNNLHSSISTVSLFVRDSACIVNSLADEQAVLRVKNQQIRIWNENDARMFIIRLWYQHCDVSI